MSEVHERIILVMAGLVFAHPRFRCRQAGIFLCILQVSLSTRGSKQFRRAPLHIITEGRFLVTIRSAIGVSLLHTFLLPPKVINFDPRLQATFCERSMNGI